MYILNLVATPYTGMIRTEKTILVSFRIERNMIVLKISRPGLFKDMQTLFLLFESGRLLFVASDAQCSLTH